MRIKMLESDTKKGRTRANGGGPCHLKKGATYDVLSPLGKRLVKAGKAEDETPAPATTTPPPATKPPESKTKGSDGGK